MIYTKTKDKEFFQKLINLKNNKPAIYNFYKTIEKEANEGCKFSQLEILTYQDNIKELYDSFYYSKKMKEIEEEQDNFYNSIESFNSYNYIQETDEENYYNS